MNTRFTQFIPVILALAAIGFSYFSLWCTGEGQLCYRTWLDRVFLDIINPLYFFALFFFPISVILAFISRSAFNSWLKFAAWAIPLAVIFIAATPVFDTSLLPFDRDDAARLAGGVFAVASFLFILFRWFSARRQNPAQV